jgi:hypothetical protein
MLAVDATCGKVLPLKAALSNSLFQRQKHIKACAAGGVLLGHDPVPAAATAALQYSGAAD